MKYRPEIDGLRALAVIPVILFHAGFSLFQGGFVGVDIFFVISGYLITSILITDLDNQKFSIISFYERRARRLLPALFFVLISSIPFAIFLFIPIDLKNFGQSLVAVSFFSSNFLFWLEFDYFDAASELKPLIHTWSLAVEEQFYILFPILLLFIWRLGRNTTLIIFFVLFLISILLSEWASNTYPTAGFFLLPFRGWELLIGAFLSVLIKQYGFIKSNNLNQMISLTGILLIILSIVFFDHETPFPGFIGLLPTLGTSFLILSAVPGTWVFRFLTIRLIILMGLISYSAYLWHQPMLVYARYFFGESFNIFYLIIFCILPFLFAYFTWKYIEQPFRDRLRFSRISIFTFSFLGIILFFGIGLTLHLTNGLSHRLPDELKEEYLYQPGTNCSFFNFGSELFTSEEVSSCLDNSSDSVFLVGDSHANALSYSLSNELNKIGLQVINISSPGCFPIFGTKNPSKSEVQEANCDAMKDFIQQRVLNLKRPIILSSRWRLSIEGDRYNNGEGGIEWGNPSPVYLTSDHSKERLYLHTEDELTKLGEDLKLIIINQIPEVGSDPIRNKFVNNSRVLDHDYSQYLSQNDRINSMFRKVVNASIIQTDKLVCDLKSKRCKTEINGKLLYMDSHHPSIEFSNLIALEIKKFFLTKDEKDTVLKSANNIKKKI